MGWLWDLYSGYYHMERQKVSQRLNQPELPMEFHETLDPLQAYAACECRCGMGDHPMDMYLDEDLNKLFINEAHREEYVDGLIDKIQGEQ